MSYIFPTSDFPSFPGFGWERKETRTTELPNHSVTQPYMLTDFITSNGVGKLRLDVSVPHYDREHIVLEVVDGLFPKLRVTGKVDAAHGTGNLITKYDTFIIEVPFAVGAESITAVLENGVLTIIGTKIDMSAPTKKIEVK